MPKSKATKKFEKNHLKDTLEKRKEAKKFKLREQAKLKRKARNAQDNEKAEPLASEVQKGSKHGEEDANGNPFGEMSVDDFFQGGFEIPAMDDPKDAQKRKEPAPKTGKRKRSAEKETKGSGSSEESEGEKAGSADIESSEGEDDHKEQLEALAKNDPEFYKYLKDNDAELLDFDEDVDLGDLQLSDDEEEDTEGPNKKRKANGKIPKGKDGELTKSMVKNWKSAMVGQHSLAAMKEVIMAFRAAAHLNETDGAKYKYSISSPDAYHELLVVALKHVPEVLQHHLPVKDVSSGKARVPTNTQAFKTLNPTIRSHTMAVVHLMSTLSDASTLKMTLSSLLPIVPYIQIHKKLVREVVKAVTTVWSTPSTAEATRIAAFLVLRRLVVIGDAVIKEVVLKSAYQGLVKGTRTTSMHTIAGINLMKNSAAELFGLDPDIGYTTGFTFIRQLAIHLRSSITNTSKESYKQVYNWQYIHSLDFWSRVLSAHCTSLSEAVSGGESPLRPLVYPVTQVTLGAMRLIPTAQYFPLRFQLVRALLRLSRATGTYIPLAASLYEVLNSAEMRKAPKQSTLRPLDFELEIRAPKTYLKTRVYQDGIGEQVVELMSEFFVLWSKNIAFPELALPVVVMLKRWYKDASGARKKSGPAQTAQDLLMKDRGNKNGKVNSSVHLLIQKLEANSRWIEERRAKVEFAPNNRSQVDAFLKDVDWEKTPLGAFVDGQRKGREEKTKMIQLARQQDKDKKRNEVDDDDEIVEEAGVQEEDDEEMIDMDDELPDEDVDEDEDEDEGEEMESESE
ncbi:nucleolar complex protein 2 [Aulographum hederae CBS 113979]|uniref:Nucleolar complex protein 2 n=1 Tax=Aulographum hederae CBS 113979 TaxID=1176131 RepID=A0A6G1H672_9PEZI|nr:nucleolar complex protein 2 [Aulographum hederae CBS 113979]